MSRSTERHLDDDTAEKYSLEQLSDRNVKEVEAHLLICESCRQTVATSDAYVSAMRNAASELRKEEQRPKESVAGK
jgi:hypothetical protein